MPELQRLHDGDEGINRGNGLNISFSSPHSLSLASSEAAAPQGKSGNAAEMLTISPKSILLPQKAGTNAAAMVALGQHS